MHKFYDVVVNVLKQDARFFSEDGEILRNAVYEATMKMDEKLLILLFNNEKIKSRFFTKIGEEWVFDKIAFSELINNKELLPDSFTRYKNKIGLVDFNKRFIATSNDVELVFPYKDCVLEGGQTKDDQKQDEVFYNTALVPDEVDRLLYPKVFSNAIRYSKDGKKEVSEFKKTDNLIINGNNLLVMASLLKRYEGLVQCIYIDPPYYFNKNKPSDSFRYNSNFKLSTWLVFMKNRLKLAKKLLAKEGVIFCHIGEDGVAWLKIIMQEIFGDNNFVETFIWKNTDNPDSLSNKSRASVEYIICFEKERNNSKKYIGKDTENGDAPLLNSGNKVHELSFPSNSIVFNIPDGVYDCGKPDRVEILKPITVVKGKNVGNVLLKGEFKWSQDTLNKEIAAGTYFLIKSSKFSIRFQRKNGTSMAPEKFIDSQYLSKAIGIGTNEDATSHLDDMGIDFSYSKPESLIAFFLKAVTKENDLVMDFFVGSGTTAAVAHKMNRLYIGIDQMDYLKTTAVERMKKVINGEQGGVSHNFEWQGGGSFVYCELAKLNQKYVDEIIEAKTDKQLGEVWKKIKVTGFISARIDPKNVNPEASDFKALSFDEKKKLFMDLLDMNQLYVNYCDIDDKELNVSEEDKAFTKSFYKEQNK